jgi:hypothetical protein
MSILKPAEEQGYFSNNSIGRALRQLRALHNSFSAGASIAFIEATHTRSKR